MAKSSKIPEEDAYEIISQELDKYGGYQKTSGSWQMVCCPFHDDNSPSCGVYMRRDDPNRKLGSFNCFSCAEGKGGWNKFAEKTGLRKIKEWDLNERTASCIVSKADDEALLGEAGTSLKQLLTSLDALEAQPWPDYINWRGIPGKVVSAIGGMIISDNYNDDIGVLFPVVVRKKVKGAVKAVNQKRYKTQLGYITSPGPWVKSAGLFPYDFVKSMIKEMDYDFVILVEGPRDALRLIKLGIPALAILGVNNLGTAKVRLLQNLGVSTIYVMPDNDKAGKEMWVRIKKFFEDDQYILLRRLKLPKEKDEKGNIIKMDPFSAPKHVILALKEVLVKRNSWQPYVIGAK
jgi:5S rRNA maturation endonuclease (ribonuclease M5)